MQIYNIFFIVNRKDLHKSQNGSAVRGLREFDVIQLPVWMVIMLGPYFLIRSYMGMPVWVCYRVPAVSCLHIGIIHHNYLTIPLERTFYRFLDY